MMSIVEHKIKEGKLLLDFYHYTVPDNVVYILAELYRYRVKSEQHLINYCSCEKMFYNLNYFINHFISQNGNMFCEDIHSMLFVKKYPFAIIARKLENSEEYLIFGTRKKEEQYLIYEMDGNLNKLTLGEIEYIFSNSRVEWCVIIPPKKNIKKSDVMILSFLKTVRYLKEYLEDSNEVDIDIKHIHYMIDFMKYIQLQNESLDFNQNIRDYEDLENLFKEETKIMDKRQFLNSEHIILSQIYVQLENLLNDNLGVRM